MSNLLDLVLFDSGRVFNRFLECWVCIAVGNYVKPVAIPTVFGDPPLIWGKEHGPGGLAYALNLNKA